MLTSIFQSAAAGWIGRRVQELGALASIFVPVYLAMSPAMKADVHAIFMGQGGGLTLSAAGGLAWYLWTQFQSYRATTKPQVVTTAGKKLPLTPTGSKEAEAIAKLAPMPRSLWERLFSR
jgi:hypothetical protein